MNLAFINSFTQLISLEIEYIHEDLTIKLPTLKFAHIQKDHCRITLDTPKLQYLKIDDLLQFNVIYPNEIKYLEINMPDEKILQFKNLESLVVFYDRMPRYPFQQHLHRVLFDRFQNLKLFCYNHGKWYIESSFADTLSFILDQKASRRRPDFKVYLCGAEIRSKQTLEGYNASSKVKFLFKNYDLLNKNYNYSQIKVINYTDLIEQLNGIPNDFLKRFFNIQHVKVWNRVKIDEEQLVDFLSRLPHLKLLELQEFTDQSFCDKLTDILKCKCVLLFLNESKPTEKMLRERNSRYSEYNLYCALDNYNYKTGFFSFNLSEREL